MAERQAKTKALNQILRNKKQCNKNKDIEVVCSPSKNNTYIQIIKHDKAEEPLQTTQFIVMDLRNKLANKERELEDAILKNKQLVKALEKLEENIRYKDGIIKTYEYSLNVLTKKCTLINQTTQTEEISSTQTVIKNKEVMVQNEMKTQIKELTIEKEQIAIKNQLISQDLQKFKEELLTHEYILKDYQEPLLPTTKNQPELNNTTMCNEVAEKITVEAQIHQPPDFENITTNLEAKVFIKSTTGKQKVLIYGDHSGKPITPTIRKYLSNDFFETTAEIKTQAPIEELTKHIFASTMNLAKNDTVVFVKDLCEYEQVNLTNLKQILSVGKYTNLICVLTFNPYLHYSKQAFARVQSFIRAFSSKNFNNSISVIYNTRKYRLTNLNLSKLIVNNIKYSNKSNNISLIPIQFNKGSNMERNIIKNVNNRFDEIIENTSDNYSFVSGEENVFENAMITMNDLIDVSDINHKTNPELETSVDISNTSNSGQQSNNEIIDISRSA